MGNRPRSVTIIAWVLIVLGGISLITTTLMLDNPQARELMSQNLLPIPLQYAMTYISLLIMLISGIAMLKGRNWGRYLYVIATGLSFLIGVVTSPMKAALIPGFVLFVIVCFFLFRAKANEYFASPKPESDAQGA